MPYCPPLDPARTLDRPHASAGTRKRGSRCATLLHAVHTTLPCSRCTRVRGRCGGCCIGIRTRRTRGSSCAAPASPTHHARTRSTNDGIATPACSWHDDALAPTAMTMTLWHSACGRRHPSPSSASIMRLIYELERSAARAAWGRARVHGAARHLGLVLIDLQRFRQLTCTYRMLPLPSSTQYSTLYHPSFRVLHRSSCREFAVLLQPMLPHGQAKAKHGRCAVVSRMCGVAPRGRNFCEYY